MKLFGVTYQFLSCGSVFTDGLAHAAAALGLSYAHAGWDCPDLSDRIAAFAPDLLFVVHGRRFAQRFSNLKGFGCPTAVWLLDEPYETDETASWSSLFEHVFVNDRATLDRHPRASYLPVGYDPFVQRHDYEEFARAQTVGFIGGGNASRERYLGALARKGWLTYVVGGPWSDPAVARRCLSLNIPPSATADLYRSTRIVLNVFRDIHHFNRAQIPATALNPRIYEATACGALVVSEWRPEVDAIVPELPTFRSEHECVDLIAYLVANPDEAEEIRQACEARLAPHTYAARLQTVLAACGLREVAA